MGGQVGVPFYGAMFVNVSDRRLQQGQFQLGNSSLYVSRGVGYLKQVRLFCRPEVPTFVMRRASKLSRSTHNCSKPLLGPARRKAREWEEVKLFRRLRCR